MSLFDSCEFEILQTLVGVAPLAATAAPHLGLCGDAPHEDGSELHELSGGGYSRVAVTPSTWWVLAGSPIYNVSPITFPEATADWGWVTHFVLLDGSGVGARKLLYGPLANPNPPHEALPIYVMTGVSVRFDIGMIKIYLD